MVQDLQRQRVSGFEPSRNAIECKAWVAHAEMKGLHAAANKRIQYEDWVNFLFQIETPRTESTRNNTEVSRTGLHPSVLGGDLEARHKAAFASNSVAIYSSLPRVSDMPPVASKE